MYLPVPPTNAIYTGKHHQLLPSPDTTGIYYLCMNYQYLIVLDILFLTINAIHSTCLYCQYIYHQYLLVISISCNIEYTMIPALVPWLNQILW